VIEVTVVLCARDAAEVLPRQLDAVVPQLDDDVELVVVDNASTDTLAEVIGRWAAGHARIRVVHAPVAGINRARNAGIAAARGRLVLLCDADDVVHPGWVSSLRATLAHADLAGGRIEAVDTRGRPVRLGSPRDFDMWGLSSPWGASCGFARPVWERLGGFDERMSGGFDEMDFFVRAQLAGASLAWSDATVDYTWEPDPGKLRRRERERDLHSCRAYWLGRALGKPRASRVGRDLAALVVRAPGAIVSTRVRTAWWTTAVRRWDRTRGFVRFGVAEWWRQRGRARRAESSVGPQDHEGHVVEP
jgi:glycosyltransferase involved in cell wall biosynthesis